MAHMPRMICLSYLDNGHTITYSATSVSLVRGFGFLEDVSCFLLYIPYVFLNLILLFEYGCF